MVKVVSVSNDSSAFSLRKS